MKDEVEEAMMAGGGFPLLLLLLLLLSAGAWLDRLDVHMGRRARVVSRGVVVVVVDSGGVAETNFYGKTDSANPRRAASPQSPTHLINNSTSQRAPQLRTAATSHSVKVE